MSTTRACTRESRESAVGLVLSEGLRFRNAILFHLGGLDLHPRPASAHTIS
jgi:hypothetical protein